MATTKAFGSMCVLMQMYMIFFATMLLLSRCSLALLKKAFIYPVGLGGAYAIVTLHVSRHVFGNFDRAFG